MIPLVYAWGMGDWMGSDVTGAGSWGGSVIPPAPVVVRIGSLDGHVAVVGFGDGADLLEGFVLHPVEGSGLEVEFPPEADDVFGEVSGRLCFKLRQGHRSEVRAVEPLCEPVT